MTPSLTRSWSSVTPSIPAMPMATVTRLKPGAAGALHQVQRTCDDQQRQHLDDRADVADRTPHLGP